MGVYTLRRDLLHKGQVAEAMADLVRQLNVRFRSEAPAESPYSLEVARSVRLRVTDVRETLVSDDLLKVDVTVSKHSWLYEARWRRSGGDDWEANWTQTANLVSFSLSPPGPWEAEVRVKATEKSPWSEWVAASGEGVAKGEYGGAELESVANYGPPGGVTAVQTSRGIKVVWTPPKWAGIAHYIVRKSETPDFSSSVEVAKPAGIMYVDGDVGEGVTYYYWVAAKHQNNTVGEFGGPSSAVGPPLGQGGELLPLSVNDVHINWGALREYKTNWSTHLIY